MYKDKQWDEETEQDFNMFAIIFFNSSPRKEAISNPCHPPWYHCPFIWFSCSGSYILVRQNLGNYFMETELLRCDRMFLTIVLLDKCSHTGIKHTLADILALHGVCVLHTSSCIKKSPREPKHRLTVCLHDAHTNVYIYLTICLWETFLWAPKWSGLHQIV